MRLSDIKGERALDVLADILEPAAVIMTDKEFLAHARGGSKLKAAQVVIRNHKKEIIAIMARLNGVEPENYEFNLISLPVQVIQLLNDPEAMILFQLQGQNGANGSSGSATENTEETEQTQDIS